MFGFEFWRKSVKRPPPLDDRAKTKKKMIRIPQNVR